MILPNEADVLAAAHAACLAPIEHARRIAGGALPPIRTMDFVEGDVAVRRAALLVCGLAWVVNDPEQVIRARLSQASSDVHGGDDRLWRRFADNHVPYEELVRRRGEAGPLAAAS